MSQISEISKNIQHADTQSLQSAQVLSAQQISGSQTQQRSGGQTERSGRGDRQRVQRSSSSASSRSGSAGARAEGALGAGSYQQYSAEGGVAQGTNNASFGSAASGERRQGRYRRQVIRLPDQAQGQVRQVRRRLPTPEPDTLERVYIQRTANEIVEEITEIPTTPPPRIQERTVVEPAGPPQVVKRTIRVPPRSGGFGGYQQQQQQGASFQSASSNVGSANINSFPLPTSSYQQAGANYSGGYSAGAIPAATSAFGSIGGGYQQPAPQAPIVFSVGGAGSSQPLPPAGCQPAFCFYV